MLPLKKKSLLQGNAKTQVAMALQDGLIDRTLCFLSLALHCGSARTMVHGSSGATQRRLSQKAAQAPLHIPLFQVTFPGLGSQANYLRNKQL